jgi:MFS family permease
MLPRRASFWIVATLLTMLLFAASTPSPLYPTYQAMWHFTPVTLTVIYGVYAFGALVALLIAGRISDYTGRRRVVAPSLVLQIVAMLAFIGAQGVEWLAAARVLQGLATGVATGALSAWLLDLQPPEEPRLGGVVGGLALVAGLALGALGSGLLVQYGPDPLHLVYVLLVAVYLVALAAILVMPDVMQRRPGWQRSLRVQIGVPEAARGPFIAMAPAIVAVWAVAGLYLAFGPSLAISLLGSTDRVAGGLVIAALLGAGTLTSWLARQSDPQAIVVPGSLVLVAGVAITIAAVALGSPIGFYAGSLVAGLGFGPAFAGAFRSIVQLAPPDARGELLAALYVVIYLSFSVPTILAGLGATAFGLRETTYAYGVVVIALAIFTTVAVARRRAGRPAAG